MFTNHKISIEEHHAWFEKMQADQSSECYIWYDRHYEPGGVVSFTHLDKAQKTAFWGFYTRPDAERGTGTRILYDALEHAFNKLGLFKLCGEVLATNTASLKMHEKCGFKIEGTFRAQHFDGEQRVDIIRFGLMADEWTSHRDNVRAHLERFTC